MRIFLVSILLLPSLSLKAFTWSEASFAVAFQSICNLNTNYTTTGVVDSDLYLHNLKIDVSPSNTKVEGTCSALNIGQSLRAGFLFSVSMDKNDLLVSNLKSPPDFMKHTRNKVELSFLGTMFSPETDEFRSFELIFKSKTFISGKNGADEKLLNLKEIVVYPYHLGATEKSIVIDTSDFGYSQEEGWLDVVTGFFDVTGGKENFKKSNILRIPFDSYRWKQQKNKIDHRVTAVRTRGLTFFRSDRSFFLVDINLLDHAGHSYRNLVGEKKATDILIPTGNSTYLGCSFSQNDDGNFNKPSFISRSDCLYHHP